MNRRALLLAATASAAALSPFVARAQKKMPVIGILGFGQPDDPGVKLNLAGFRQALGESGFVEGKNVAIEYRWAKGDESRLPVLAADLVARHVDVIVTEGGFPAASAAKAATSTIPVVFHTADAIADGIVGNLARPGGNLTGVSLFAPELGAKQFQLLLEVVPKARVVGVLAVPKNIVHPADFRRIDEAARAKGIHVEAYGADAAGDLDDIYASFARQRIEGLVVHANVIYADKVIALAARYPVPAVYSQRAFADRGGLLSYSANFPAIYVIKGRYAAKLLQGAKPADLPVQQPDKFELVINLKAAKALGLTVPQSVLARADEVIE